MSSVTPNTTLEPEASVTPRYAAGARRGTYTAKFNDGTSVEVQPGRARLYPGLRSEAPAMAPFYDAFARLVSAESRSARVLDAGCGSGVGTRRLLAHGLSVVAVDNDSTATAFAKHHASGAHVEQVDLTALQLESRVDGAILADVLSHCSDPDAVLLAVARALLPGGQLLVAEPTAHVSQRVSAPQRRGFSLAQLKSLLIRCGFSLESVVLGRVPFVALLARADASGVAAAFSKAYALAAQGDLDGALSALSEARERARAEVELEGLLAEAEIHMARGDGDSAARCYFRGRELAAEDAPPLVGLGRIALAGDDANQALSLALNALDLDATEPAAYALAGVAADALGHPDAFTAWRAAANLAPDDPMIAGELMRNASARGDHRLALANLERLERYGVELSGDQHVTRAWLLLRAGKRGEAALEARIAATKHADSAALRELEAAISRG